MGLFDDYLDKRKNSHEKLWQIREISETEAHDNQDLSTSEG